MSILQQLIGYAALYFIARYMGPKPLGILSSALAFATTFMIFGDLGYGIAHVKKVSEGKELGKCIGTYAVIKTILTFMAGFICLIAFFSLKKFGKKPPVPDGYQMVFFVVLAGVIIGNIAQIIQHTNAARLEKAKEWASIISQKIVTSVLKVITVVLGLGVIYLAWSTFIGSVAGLMVGVWFFRKFPISKFDRHLFVEYTKFALPSFLIGVSSALALQLDKVFLSMLGNVEQVGYYTAAQSIVLIIMFISVIFISLLLPSYSRMYADQDIEGIRRLSQKIERYVSFPLIAAGTFIFFFSGPIQHVLLHNRFNSSAVIIKILIIDAMFLIFAQPYTSQLMGMNRIKLSTILSVLMIFLNIFFYYLLIPERMFGFKLFGLGASGAAAALLISNFIGTGLFRYYAFRLSGSKPNFCIFIHLLCGVFVFGPLYHFLKNWKHINNFFVLAGLALSGGIIYLLILFLTRQFKYDDFLFYFQVINPRKLGKYIKNELRS